MFDPKAYFAQFQQQAASSGQAPAPFGAPVAAPAAAPSASSAAPAGAGTEKSEIHRQVEEASSAIRCAAIVKEKGHNFTTAVAIEALHTMAVKSGLDLRKDLLKQVHVRKLCERVEGLVQKPPAGLGLENLARAAWCVARFPREGQPEPEVLLGATARVLSSTPVANWEMDSAGKVLWSLAKAGVIQSHKALVSQVVAELVRDKGRRIAQLSEEGLINLLWSVARARLHRKEGDHNTVRIEANDELLFSMAGARVISDVDKFEVFSLAELAHTHAEIGIKNEQLFKAMCPVIIGRMKELREDVMARVIQAYTRFMLPLKEDAQGFRTMAVVAKGDFQRPSEKPKKRAKLVYEHPVALYPATQVHARA